MVRETRKTKDRIFYYSEFRLRAVAQCEGTLASVHEFRDLVAERWVSRRMLSFLKTMRTIVANEKDPHVQVDSMAVLIDALIMRCTPTTFKPCEHGQFVFDLSVDGYRTQLYELIVAYWDLRSSDADRDLGFYHWRSYFREAADHDREIVKQRYEELLLGYQARLSGWLQSCGLAWINKSNDLSIQEGVSCPAGHCLIQPADAPYEIRVSASYLDRDPSYKTFKNITIQPGDIHFLSADWPGGAYGIWEFSRSVMRHDDDGIILPTSSAPANACTNTEFSDRRFKRPASAFEQWLATKRQIRTIGEY